MKKFEEKGSVYRHFKGKFYRVIGLGIESETKDVQVVYETIAPEKSSNLWVRNANMFNSPTDKEKYPDADQDERFKCVDIHIKYARHCIGLDNEKPYKRHGKKHYEAYRNYYCAGCLDPIWEDMVKWGFANRNATKEKYTTYWMTEEGIEWLTKVCDDVDFIRERH